MNIQVKLTLLVVETQVRVATGQEQHKQIPGKFYSEFIYLIILNTKIKHKRVMRETCIIPLKQLESASSIEINYSFGLPHNCLLIQ